MFQCSVNINSNEQFLKSGQWPQLTIYSAGHALQVFVNGQSYGIVCLNLVDLSTQPMLHRPVYLLMKHFLVFFNCRHRVWRLRQPEANIQRVREKMWQGSNKISILNAAVGLPVSSPHRKFRIIYHLVITLF